MRKNTAEKFWAMVDQSSDESCWPWLGYENTNGYGHLHYQGRIWTAHRLAWALSYGEIEDKDDSWHGTVVMHSCDNRLCCNPKHLSLGTQADNIADMEAKGRRVSGRQPGSQNARSKLTEDQVIEIHAMLKCGIKRKAIAFQFGVSRDLISQIRVGVRWRHVYLALTDGERLCR